MTTASPSPSNNTRSPRWLLHIGAVASAALFAAFLIGAFGMFQTRSLPARNWLTVLFDLNFRIDSTPPPP